VSKAEVQDGIPGESLKLFGSTEEQEYFAICDQIYGTAGVAKLVYRICNSSN